MRFLENLIYRMNILYSYEKLICNKSFMLSKMYIVSGIDDKRNADYILTVEHLKIKDFKKSLSSDIIHLKNYGVVQVSYYENNLIYKEKTWHYLKKYLFDFKYDINVQNILNAKHKNFKLNFTLDFLNKEIMNAVGHDLNIFLMTDKINYIFEDSDSLLHKFIRVGNLFVIKQILLNKNFNMIANIFNNKR